MTKGPGRSDCCRIGVTYGCRECLREGRVRQSSVARSPVNLDWAIGRRAYVGKTLSQSARAILLGSWSAFLSEKPFSGVSWRPYIEKFAIIF